MEAMSFRYVKLPEVPARKFLPYPYLGLQDWDENTWIYNNFVNTTSWDMSSKLSVPS